MCGIAGIIDSQHLDIADQIQRMAILLSHRGPDATRTKTYDGAALGHTRLSIIDLATGDQPMSCPEGRFHITYNGEIYNFRELRQKLESTGYRFRTNSDTEVVLALYINEGEAGLNKLNGMFAFAVWDSHERKLFAARDRIGKKPFYFAFLDDGGIVFASELKAILRAGLIRGNLNWASLDEYLALGYLSPDRCIYTNIRTLPPAHCLSWCRGNLVISNYWTPRFMDGEVLNDHEAIEEFDHLVRRAVNYRMVADVPVGAFLSGGLDSSTIVPLMQQGNSEPVSTFSVGFGDLINELPFARSVALQERTKHHEIQVNINVADLLVKMAEIFDEPLADSANIPTYEISRFARKHVKTVLTGEGADELLGGYDYWYQPLRRTEKLNCGSLAYGLIRLICRANAIGMRFGLPLDKFKNNAWENRKYMESARSTREILNWHLDRVAIFPTDRLKQLRRGTNVSWQDYLDRCPSSLHSINRALWFDFSHHLMGDIVTKLDRASMAVGLETRCPFLDVHVVEFCLSLPLRFKVGTDCGKLLLRNTFRELWPEQLLGRAKQGFGAPEREWLRRADVRELVEEVIMGNGSDIQSILEPKLLIQGTRKFYSNQPGMFSASQLWTLLVLGLWLKEWSPLK